MRLTGMALAVFALLAGCGEEQQELRGWMEEQRRKTPAVTEKIEPPKQFEPFRYAADGRAFTLAERATGWRTECGATGRQPPHRLHPARLRGTMHDVRSIERPP